MSALFSVSSETRAEHSEVGLGALSSTGVRGALCNDGSKFAKQQLPPLLLLGAFPFYINKHKRPTTQPMNNYIIIIIIMNEYDYL